MKRWEFFDERPTLDDRDFIMRPKVEKWAAAKRRDALLRAAWWVAVAALCTFPIYGSFILGSH